MKRGAVLKNTALTALGGVISALSVFIMFLSGIFPFLTYVIPVFSGLLIIVLVREVDLKWAFFVYCAVSILSLLMVADKESAVMYACFFGYYPIAKDIIEAHLKTPFSQLAKFLLFNVAIVLGYVAIIYVFGIPIEDMDEFGKYTPLVLLALGNLVFVVYDMLIRNLNFLYVKKLHKIISKIFDFNFR